jgi:ribokinase
VSSDRRWDVVVVGGANWDYLVRGATLPTRGCTVEGDEFQEAPGGKGANQAVAAARLGARVAFVARVGKGERGDKMIERLDRENVDTHHVVRDEKSTGIALIHVSADGEKQIMTAPGANRRLSGRDIESSRFDLESTRVALFQLEIPMPTVLAAARVAHAAGARVVLDPAPASPLPDELLPLLHLVRPNSDEAKTLTGVSVHDRATARSAADRLLARGVSAVAVQAGGEGNLLVWREGEAIREVFLPRIAVTAVDATGAGDAFAAAIAVMIAEGRPLPDAAAFANAAAALATTRVGAQAALPTRAEVDALLAAQAVAPA